MLGILEYKNTTGSGNIAAALQYVLDDIKTGMYQENVLADSWNEMGAIYEQGKAAAVYNYVNNSLFTNLQTSDPELLAATRMVPFPQIKEAVKPVKSQVALAAEHNYYVSKKAWTSGSAKQDALARFMDFLYSKDVIINFAKYSQVALDLDYEFPPEDLSPTVRDAMRYASGKEEIPFYLAIIPDSSAWQDFKNATMDCVSGEVSPRDTEKLIGTIFDAMEKPQ
jgi:ABC-type glycerol-3-phosphate transport system substrate-binding protein